ncbi:AraC family transcriptional regulator [Rossellomorea vietnamensis]|uniref:AraC family transcriptional regulator n=1 Tax=Rossellomorea vietnamensis TaxID=218284 RepID=A0A5D4KD51_9BACI|nr:AraC family transcriptional regulator [Rossellomorea vietnamensis]TYR74680.1 AraC family transcriptional regulator [Rossellomorea vietnamensis]
MNNDISEKQVNKVLEYIESHLTEELNLETLAAVSDYSPYHFQRLFKKTMGETPAGYVKRLRLESAAHMLIYEARFTITETAFLCGFSSLSYFTYSFTENFGFSPKAWREGGYLEHFPREYLDSKNSKLLRNNTKAAHLEKGYTDFKWLDLNKVKVVHIPDCHTINRYHIGSYVSGIPSVWEGLCTWSKSRGLITEATAMIGVPRSNPYITPPDKNRYDCRVEVPLSEIEKHGEEAVFFKGGNYALYEFDDPVSYEDRGIMIECYSELYSYWLPKSGYKYLSNPIEFVEVQKGGVLDFSCRIRAIGLAIEPK